MPRPIPDAAYVHRFNARLAELNSPARVALIRLDAYSGMLELRDNEENFLDLFRTMPPLTWLRSRSGSTPVALASVSAAAKRQPSQSCDTSSVRRMPMSNSRLQGVGHR